MLIHYESFDAIYTFTAITHFLGYWIFVTLFALVSHHILEMFHLILESINLFVGSRTEIRKKSLDSTSFWMGICRDKKTLSVRSDDVTSLDSESRANEAVIWIQLDMDRNVSTVAALAVRSRVKSIPSSSRRLVSLFVVILITFLTFSLCLCVLERIERCKLMLVRKKNEGEMRWMKVRR